MCVCVCQTIAALCAVTNITLRIYCIFSCHLFVIITEVARLHAFCCYTHMHTHTPGDTAQNVQLYLGHCAPGLAKLFSQLYNNANVVNDATR